MALSAEYFWKSFSLFLVLFWAKLSPYIFLIELGNLGFN